MISRCTSAALEELEELVARVLDVVLGLLQDAALVARLRPAALVVPAVHVVDDADDLAHAVAPPARMRASWRLVSSTRVAVAAGHAGERLDERRVVDRHLAGDRPRQPVDVEQVDRRTQAKTATPRVPLASNSLVEPGPDPLDVVLQLLLLRRAEAVVAQAPARPPRSSESNSVLRSPSESGTRSGRGSGRGSGPCGPRASGPPARAGAAWWSRATSLPKGVGPGIPPVPSAQTAHLRVTKRFPG